MVYIVAVAGGGAIKTNANNKLIIRITAEANPFIGPSSLISAVSVILTIATCWQRMTYCAQVDGAGGSGTITDAHEKRSP